MLVCCDYLALSTQEWNEIFSFRRNVKNDHSSQLSLLHKRPTSIVPDPPLIQLFVNNFTTMWKVFTVDDCVDCSYCVGCECCSDEMRGGSDDVCIVASLNSSFVSFAGGKWHRFIVEKVLQLRLSIFRRNDNEHYTDSRIESHPGTPYQFQLRWKFNAHVIQSRLPVISCSRIPLESPSLETSTRWLWVYDPTTTLVSFIILFPPGWNGDFVSHEMTIPILFSGNIVQLLCQIVQLWSFLNLFIVGEGNIYEAVQSTEPCRCNRSRRVTVTAV